jgi:hypothetical protein
MNPITPQQFQDHASDHRRRLIADLKDARAARPPDGSHRRLAPLAAAALVAATAFLTGGMVDADVAAPASVPAEPANNLRIQAPDCAVETGTDDSSTVPVTTRRVNRHRGRLDQIPV